MDFTALQHKLFELDPTDPKEDLAKIKSSLTEGKSNQPVQADYVNESFDVPEGSLPLDKDYSVGDFAALAGVVTEGKQKNGDYARANKPMPKAKPGRTKHPLRDKLVGETESASVEDRLDAIESKLDTILNSLGSQPSTVNKPATTEQTATDPNLKTRQKNEDTIKLDLYSRLNRMLDE